MNIPEVIVTVESIKHVCRGLLLPKEQKALSISIEALKVVTKWREEHRDLGFLLLPGETEE